MKSFIFPQLVIVLIILNANTTFSQEVQVSGSLDMMNNTIKNVDTLVIGTQEAEQALDINGALRISGTANNKEGSIKYNSHDFLGYDGARWLSFTDRNNLWGGVDTNNVLTDKIIPSNGDADDNFGGSIALNDDFLFVGARYDDEFANNGGSVTVYKRMGGSWSFHQNLSSLDISNGDNFGADVATDGTTLIVSATGDDDNGSNSGSVYIFELSNGLWVESQKIIASDAAQDDFFGGSISIHGDYIAAGANKETTNGNDAGAAYIFHRSGNTWSEQAKIIGSTVTAYDLFGSSVYLDGDKLIVGSPSITTFAPSAGIVYVFKRSGAVWTEEAQFSSSIAFAQDQFGFDVVLQGDLAVIGDYRSYIHGPFAGAGFVFKYNGTNWVEDQILYPNLVDANDELGYSLAISGEYVLVGASQYDNFTGGAMLFKIGPDSLELESIITAFDGGGVDDMGNDVAIHGNKLAIGALLNDNENGVDAGAVYISENQSSTSIEWNDLSGIPSDFVDNIDDVDDADSDPTNEFNTALSLVGSTLNITDGNGTLMADLSALSNNWQQIQPGDKLSYEDGNVGIATNNPSTALEVNGTTTSEMVVIDGASNNKAFQWDSGFSAFYNSADALQLDRPNFHMFLDADNSNSNTANSHTFRIFSNVTTSSGNTPIIQMDMHGGDTFFDHAGDFGIGTTNPTDALHVNSMAGQDAFRVQVSGGTKMRVFSNGAVVFGNTGGVGADVVYVKNLTGLGVLNPTYKLELPDNASIGVGRARANAWVTYSDKRVKKNVEDIDYGLSAIMDLRAVKYDHHGSSFANGVFELGHDSYEDIGFLAQDVYEVIEEVVVKPENESTDLWSMDYEKLTPVLVKAIQEQQTQIEEQKSLLAKQQELINQLMTNQERLIQTLNVESPK